jgi:hypothetical protein
MAKHTSDLPFDERLFTSEQTQRLLAVGKTTFFDKVLPQLQAFLDGNKLKISGRSIREYQERRLAEPRQPRPTSQLHKTATNEEVA